MNLKIYQKTRYQNIYKHIKNKTYAVDISLGYNELGKRVRTTRTGILDVVKSMNGNLEILDKRFVGGEVVGDILVKYSPNLNATTIDKEIIPRLIDEIPVIAVLATQCEGTTIIKDAHELKVNVTAIESQGFGALSGKHPVLP